MNAPASPQFSEHVPAARAWCICHGEYAAHLVIVLHHYDRSALVGQAVGELAHGCLVREVLVEVGLNVKRASPYEHTFIAAFSNGYMHYGPPASDYDKGGYEVTECLLAPEWQQIYEQKANEIIRRL